MRVMTYNILMGGRERVAQIAALVRSQRPDLLVLQECVGWEDGCVQVRAVAEAMEVEADPRHARVGRSSPRGSGTCYHVSVFSREPMELVVHADPRVLAHCIIEARLDFAGAPLTLFGTHFNANDETLRVGEARHLGSLLGSDGVSGLRLLVGDLNALSREDPYPVDIAERFLQHGVRKYGHPPRFDVMEELGAQGWCDTLHALAPARPWITAWRPHGNPRLGLRTDYILASPGMLGRLRRAWIVPDHEASDHAPVLAEFEAGRPGT